MAGLVLTRRVGERIWIGRHVTVKVVEIDRGQTKLLIEAPPEMAVSRADWPFEEHLETCAKREAWSHGGANEEMRKVQPAKPATIVS